jgi:hypothetical protein
MNLCVARSRMVSKAATREFFNRLAHYWNHFPPFFRLTASAFGFRYRVYSRIIGPTCCLTRLRPLLAVFAVH